MIQPRELFMGALLENGSGVITPVYDFSKYRIYFESHTAKVKLYKGGFSYEDCNPVPITNEWLDTCFNYYEDRGFPTNNWYLDGLLIWENQQKGYRTGDVTHKGATYLYRHQIQNLYQAFTLKELEFKATINKTNQQ